MNAFTPLIEELRGRPYRLGLIDELEPPHRIEFGAALSDGEIERVETRFAFAFPIDLREFLQTAVPIGDGFPDWRDGDEASLRAWLDEPKQGILFDVEHNRFWPDEWGPKPSHLDEQKVVAAAAIDAAPHLIPVFSHRVLPAEPLEAGNPVLSVHQTDVICYGKDLADYLRREFLSDGVDRVESHEGLREIRFWSTLL